VEVRILLDTNAYAGFMRGHAGFRDLIFGADEVLFSVIVLGELNYGFRRGSRLQENLRELRTFLSDPLMRVVPVGSITADRYGRIASQLRTAGRPIPVNDIWIAAQTLEYGADLVTADRHFDHVPGLVRIDPADSTR
jgi:tRNA(fMet)-specific endonuclease VapC